MYNVAFYGKSSETTGSVGYRSHNDSPTVSVNKSMPVDSVSFSGRYDENNKSSAFGTFAGVTCMAALAIIGCGYAHKTNVVSKIPNEKIRNWMMKYSPKITEPCYKLCSTIKSKGMELYKKVFV